MSAPEYRWSDIVEDHPIPLLHRKKIEGEQMLVARVRLDKGCHVEVHNHVSEQIAMIQSGHVRWTIGAEGSPDRYTREMVGGEVLHLPSNLPHCIDALEDTEIIDVLSPPGLMGVDRQGK
jgi:quercetin dioxygenase-like cupin family protein